MVEKTGPREGREVTWRAVFEPQGGEASESGSGLSKEMRLMSEGGW
jgi:hypothetical protein